jgi:hypothetical protein
MGLRNLEKGVFTPEDLKLDWLNSNLFFSFAIQLFAKHDNQLHFLKKGMLQKPDIDLSCQKIIDSKKNLFLIS